MPTSSFNYDAEFTSLSWIEQREGANALGSRAKLRKVFELAHCYHKLQFPPFEKFHIPIVRCTFRFPAVHSDLFLSYRVSQAPYACHVPHKMKWVQSETSERIVKIETYYGSFSNSVKGQIRLLRTVQAERKQLTRRRTRFQYWLCPRKFKRLARMTNAYIETHYSTARPYILTQTAHSASLNVHLTNHFMKNIFRKYISQNIPEISNHNIHSFYICTGVNSSINLQSPVFRKYMMKHNDSNHKISLLIEKPSILVSMLSLFIFHTGRLNIHVKPTDDCDTEKFSEVLHQVMDRLALLLAEYTFHHITDISV